MGEKKLLRYGSAVADGCWMADARVCHLTYRRRAPSINACLLFG